MKQLFKPNLLFAPLVIVMYLGFTTISYGQALIYVAFVQTDPLAVGEQINVNIQILNGQDVSGYEMTVGFNSTTLRYIEADAFPIPPVVSDDTIHIVASQAVDASVRESTLATITFEVIDARDSIIKLVDVILSNSAGRSLAVTTRNGRIVPIQLPPVGDVNRDGKVNILDLTLVASNITAPVLSTQRVDVNKDGIVNILDLVLVAQHLDIVRTHTVKPEIGVIPVTAEEPGTGDQPAVAQRPPIDFAAEKAEIQAVYSAFYKAFNDNDIKAISETFNTGSIKFGTVFAGNEPVPVAIGWNNVKVGINGLWIGIGTKGAKWGPNDQLSKVWIRYKGSKLEASALGINCYKGAFPGESHLYLVKDAKRGWVIQELDSITQNNLQIFGLDAKPRLAELGDFFPRDSEDTDDLAP